MQAAHKDQPRASAKEIKQVYRNSVDAFIQVAGGREKSLSVISARLACTVNGIPCCNVSIKFDGGAEYHVVAYEGEAEELYREAVARSAELKTAIPR
jgi:hypothetical protein